MSEKNKKSFSIASALISFSNSVILFIKCFFDIQNQEEKVPLYNYIIVCFYFIVMLISLCIMISVMRCAWVEYRRSSKLENKKKIAKYLAEFMNKGGRTAILSRDLSWVDGEVQSKMIEKSKRKELTIFMPRENEISRLLKEAGADIRYFGNAIHYPANSIIRSRFTIIQWGSNYARITYPKQSIKRHYNNEFSTEAPATDLAQDLIRLLNHLVPASK